MSSAVSGRATMSPTNPSNEPHTDSDNKMSTGLMLMFLPMIRGVSTRS